METISGKKIRLLVLVFFLCKITGNAQENTDTVKLWTRYPGFVITNENDTIHGILLLKNKISNQGKVFFFNKIDDEEPGAKYKPGDIKAYKVADRYYETVKFTPQNTMMRYSFLLRVIDGPITLYEAYYDDKERIKIDQEDIWNSKIDLSFSEKEINCQHFGKRRNEKELQFFDSMGYLLKFKKTMSEYLSDCPEIARKIAAKEKGYEWVNLYDIIREYNSTCGSDKN